jgi:putative tricarboxylic transport membrane protein
LKLSRDGWAGLVVLAASLVLFALTLSLKESPLVPIGPGFYPRIVLGLTAILAVALVVFDFLGQQRTPVGEKVPHGASYGTVLVHFALFGLYVISLPSLGFRVATVAYIAVANASLDWPASARGWARVAAIALIATTVVYFAFERYLSVLLPRGAWTGF